MAILSKPLTITSTCYELGHCWTPYCRKASTDVATHVFKEALKIYGTLYFLAGILRRKGPSYYVKKVIPEILRSSVFLTINGTLFITMFCVWRRLAGYYMYYNVYICGIPACILSIVIEQKSRTMLGCMFLLTTAFIPAYIAAFTAVICERKSSSSTIVFLLTWHFMIVFFRRGPLAVYLTNLAIETGYRMLVERNLISPVPNGEVYIFSVVSAVYLYLFRRQNGLSSSSESLFRFFVGGDENPKRAPAADKSAVSTVSTTSTAHSQAVLEPGSAADGLPSDRPAVSDNHHASDAVDHSIPSSASVTARPSSPVVNKALTLLHKLRKIPLVGCLVEEVTSLVGDWVESAESLPKHKCCPHQHSCVSYVLKGAAKMFTVGFMAQASLNSLSVMSSVLKKPSVLKNTFLNKLNLKLAGFLGGYSAIFRAVNCILRWVRNKDSDKHGFIAGALAGLSLRFYRSTTIALYAATKLIEILYFKGIESYGFPYFKSADIFIYAFSTAFIFHAAVMEPHTLRPGYWKFLLRVTDNKFALMNRHLLDVFGVKSSKIQPDYWPQYDPAFTTLTRPNS